MDDVEDDAALHPCHLSAHPCAGMLDVQQIFGRAGRPQFQDTGEGIIITTHDKLAHYLGMLTHQARASQGGQQVAFLSLLYTLFT